MASNVSYALTSRYAKALIELADKAGKLSVVEKDLNDLRAMLKSAPDFARYLRSTAISRKAQHKALNTLAEKAGFDALSVRFLGVLAQNRRLGAVDSIITAVLDVMAERRGEVTAKVEAAQDLTPAQMKSLENMLATGLKKKITINTMITPSVIGGMSVTVGSRMIDDTVRSKLARLKMSMAKGA